MECSLHPPAASPEPTQRSKRLYILWAIALTLLISTALFCWLVVVPVWQVRNAVLGCDDLGKGDKTYDDPYRRQALLLGDPANAVGKIRLYLRAPDFAAGKKDVAVELLGFCGPVAIPELQRILEGPETELHRAAIRALGTIGPPAARTTNDIVKAMRLDPKIAIIATIQLGKIGPGAKDAVPEMLKTLKAYDGRESHYIVKAIRQIGPAAIEAAPKLLEIACTRAPDPAATQATWALMEWGPACKPILPQLIETLSHEAPGIRSRAAYILAHMGPTAKEAIPALENLLKDEYAPNRQAAAEALKKIKAVQEKGVKLYSDAEAEEIKSKLGKLKLPASSEVLWRSLGVDRTRLPMSVGGGTNRSWSNQTRLSEHYWIRRWGLSGEVTKAEVFRRTETPEK
jgi:HEAT repeats